MMDQLIYCSRSKLQRDRMMLVHLRDIVASASRNNQRVGITGFLIFDQTWFVQILEGEKVQVQTLYRRIAEDPRHGDLKILDLRPVAERSFPNWNMGSAIRSPEVQAVYLRHGIGGALDPLRLKPATLVSLALDLVDFEKSQRLAAAV